MARYTFEAGAHWPESLVDLTDFKNVDNSVAQLVTTIKQLQDVGDYDSAQELIDDNIGVLDQYVFDTADVNRYVEEIRNLEIYTKSHKQQIYYQPTDPYLYVYDGDVWIGDIDQPEPEPEEEDDN